LTALQKSKSPLNKMKLLPDFHMRKNFLLVTSLIIIAIFINTCLRMNPTVLPGIDKYAKESIYKTMKEDIAKNIDSLYPDFSEEDRADISKSVFKNQLRKEKKEINNAISNLSRKFKAPWLDKDGYSYLLEVDPYRWYRRVKNYLDSGHFGTKVTLDKEYDGLMWAPWGNYEIEPIKLHFYTGAYFYKMMHFFNNKMTLAHSLSILPVLLFMFTVPAIFAACSLFGVSVWGAFVASMIVGLSPALLMRTSFGWFDTDVYNILFPLLIFLCVAFSFKFDRLKHLLILFIAGFITGIYSSLWAVWWFIVYLIAPVIFIVQFDLVFTTCANSLKTGVKKAVLSSGTYFLSTCLSVVLFSGFDGIKRLFCDPFWYFSIREKETLDNFWPSVISTISELVKAAPSDIERTLGGRAVVVGVLISLLVIFIFERKNNLSKEKKFMSYGLSFWLLVMVLLSLLGKRFLIFIAVPAGILFGRSLDSVKSFVIIVKNKFDVLSRINDWVYSAVLNVVFVTVALYPALNYTNPIVYPFMNDANWNMMLKIKEITPKNAIITSNWNYGDWIMSIGERRTLICPAYQHTPLAYWTSRVFISSSETEALNILRMLNSGGNRAFEELLKIVGADKFKAINIINQMFLLEEKDSRQLLTKYTTDSSAIDKVISYMYRPVAEAYLLIPGSMTQVSHYVWSTGSWDFNKLDLYQKFNKLNKNDFLSYEKGKFGYSKEQSEKIYQDFILTDKTDFTKMLYKNVYRIYTEYSNKYVTGVGGNLLFFKEGLVIDQAKKIGYFANAASGNWLSVSRLIFVANDEVKITENKSGDYRFTIIYSLKDGVYRAVILTTPLSEGLFSKLYYLKGIGMKHFELVHSEKNDPRGNGWELYLYKIKW